MSHGFFQITRWDDYHKVVVRPMVERRDIDRRCQTKSCLSLKKNPSSKLADSSVCRDCFSSRLDEDADAIGYREERACRFVDFRFACSLAQNATIKGDGENLTYGH